MTSRLPNPNRRHGFTEKIKGSETGLAAALYVHVDFDGTGRVQEVSFSQKGKDDSTLDKILTSLSEKTNALISKAQELSRPHTSTEAEG